VRQQIPTSTPAEALIYPFLLLIAMWLFYWAEHLFLFPFRELGVLPRTVTGLKGIIFMPLIHSPTEIQHIINNSIPTFVLLATLIHFYKPIALRVFTLLWLMTGSFLWIYAENTGSYHIGMSGVIYGLASFLFTSGVIRKYLPLQAISLFVVFVYGSMVWGLFPMEQRVSWEGHLMGFLSGIFLAFLFKRQGTQRPKFQYEIEKEMGIEPPDLEGMYLERLRLEKEREEELKRQEQGHVIIYHYRPTISQESKPEDDARLQ
jgi:membrane associated rhomboid family serine protease